MLQNYNYKKKTREANIYLNDNPFVNEILIVRELDKCYSLSKTKTTRCLHIESGTARQQEFNKV